MDMKKEFVAKVFLNLSRRSHDVIAPKISKYCYQENQTQNIESIPSKKWSCSYPERKRVYDAPHDERYD
jgi:hypothetical protein